MHVCTRVYLCVCMCAHVCAGGAFWLRAPAGQGDPGPTGTKSPFTEKWRATWWPPGPVRLRFFSGLRQLLKWAPGGVSGEEAVSGLLVYLEGSAFPWLFYFGRVMWKSSPSPRARAFPGVTVPYSCHECAGPQRGAGWRRFQGLQCPGPHGPSPPLSRTPQPASSRVKRPPERAECQLLMTFDAAGGIPAPLKQRAVSCRLYFGLRIIAETLS